MLRLRAMTETEFAAYLAISVPNYAEAKRQGEGLSEEAARKVAQESFARLLPQGLKSENQFLFTVIEAASGRNIGTLWFARQLEGAKPIAFVYDIILEPASQGKGYGRQLMALLEDEVRQRGLKAIGLHVFGNNTRARSLYEKVGYRPTNIRMLKDLE